MINRPTRVEKQAMSTRRMTKFVSAALGLWLSGGCMTSPGNGQRYASPDSPVNVGGYTTAKGDVLSIQTAPGPGGPWTELTRSDPNLGFVSNAWVSGTDPSKTTPLYSWYVKGSTVQIPRDQWSNSGSEDCQVYLRASSTANNYVYDTFDDKSFSPRGEGWMDCYTRVNKPKPINLSDFLSQCKSAQTPVVRLLAPSNGIDCHCAKIGAVQGDVTVSSQATVDSLKCISEITGSLTVMSVDGVNPLFPKLAKVDGNVTLAYTPVGANNVIPTMSFPALTTIGGSMGVQITRMPTGGAAQISMPTLQTVVGGVEIDAMSRMTGMMTLSGLPAVTTLPTLTLRLDSDATLTTLLPALTKVTGDVKLYNSGAFHDALPALAHVDGNFSIIYNAGTIRPAEGIGLQALAFVGKTLHLENTPWPSLTPAFTQLATVQGALEVLATNLSSLSMGASKLTIGSLNVNGNGAMTTLAATNVSVAGNGDISIVNNPALAECQATSFVSAQTAAGWNGNANLDDTCSQ
jgi:hypothetical protein